MAPMLCNSRWVFSRTRSSICDAMLTTIYGGVPCVSKTTTKNRAFEISSKRRKGFPSETKVKRGNRVVHRDKELIEKLGRNDLCPCGSGRRFQTLLYAAGEVGWQSTSLLFPAIKTEGGFIAALFDS